MSALPAIPGPTVVANDEVRLLPDVPTSGDGLPVPHGYVADRLDVTFVVDHPREDVWAWLCDPDTFVSGQVWPWRVEFVDPDTGEEAGFRPGVLTTHHGPGMNFSGIIGEVRAPAYRDLRYTYGAYALSPRFARPTRLQFWLTSQPQGRTLVHLRVDAQVRRRLRTLWRGGNRAFWRRFESWMQRALDDRAEDRADDRAGGR